VRELDRGELANVAYLTQNDVPFGLLEVTATGLEKSILDATEPFREFLQAFAVHDYDRQAQGPDFKVVLPASLALPDGTTVPSLASLYRPQTKKGDPRIWFKELRSIVQPGSIFAALWIERRFWVFDVSSLDLTAQVLASGVLRDLILPFVARKSSVVETLLGKLRGVAEKGFLPAPVKGSTAVGRLLETELGIDINSRRDPDFMGIEIKSSRNAGNRTTLFAKTPDWTSSKYKNSRALLNAFGYDREGRRKLSCTISGIVTNSQGLRLEVNESTDLLHVVKEGSDRHRAVQWDLEVLRHSLATKHNETFWVKAETKLVDGWEYIRFHAVQHTQKAIVAQLPSLLRDGKVTVDFLIREEGDKGYLFKLLPKNLPLLFPPAAEYVLATSDAITGIPPQAPPRLF